MLKDGTYAAWFKTPLGQGTGIAHVADGKIWGRDGVVTYDGTCEVHGDRFTATVTTKRHIEGCQRSSAATKNLSWSSRERLPARQPGM
jgi:hypothetical protein